ncbi:MAG: ATP-grasp domain-containing protein [Gorillibacterium sp.]|nr:ATP-grasp domain-containing protein [Gorillibacterium sp.]
MLKGWLIYNQADAERNRAYIDWFLSEAEAAGVELQFVSKEDLTFGVKNNLLYLKRSNEPDRLPDFCVMRNMDELLSVHLEALGVKVYNNSFVSQIANDKAKAHQYLAKHNIPMPDTTFVQADDYREANFTRLVFPVVLKAVKGRGGTEVFLIDSLEELTARVKLRLERGSDSYVVQQLVQPGKDLRVFIVGQQIVGAILRESDRDFRANFSLGGRSSLYPLNEVETSLVRQIMDLFELGMVGIDFVFGHDGSMLFNEMEDVVGSRTLSLNSDLNILKIYLDALTGIIWEDDNSVSRVVIERKEIDKTPFIRCEVRF